MADKKWQSTRGRQKVAEYKRQTKSGRVKEAGKKMQTVKTSKSQKEADS